MGQDLGGRIGQALRCCPSIHRQGRIWQGLAAGDWQRGSGGLAAGDWIWGQRFGSQLSEVSRPLAPVRDPIRVRTTQATRWQS